MTRLCPKCGGSRYVFVGDDKGAFARPCASCRGTGSEPLRDVTSDDVDDEIDALEADRSRMKALLEKALRDNALLGQRVVELERIVAQNTESKSSRPEVRGPVGETTMHAGVEVDAKGGR